MELSTLQKEIIETKYDKVVVLADPAVGKTVCITERINYLLEHGADPSKIVMITFTNMAAEEMRRRIGEKANGAFIGTIHSYANYLLLSHGVSTAELIKNENFSQFFSLIKENINCVKPVDYLLLDEAQDSTFEQFEFMLDMIKPKSFFLVGDVKQCQPAGTKVMLRNNIIKNIEDVKVGDSIVWYDANKSYVSGIKTQTSSVEKKVEKISCRDFINDNLITITTENNNKSTYTPNHITFVKINPSEYQHAVYLMCDENYRFRIGKIPFYRNREKGVNPWRQKMYQEGCCKLWILKLFKTDLEARVLETKLSYKYQIPQTCWQTNKVMWTKEDIDYIYEGLNTKESAEKCLREFNRDIKYPLLDKNIEKNGKNHFATNAVAEIYACNIIPEAMSCLVYNKELKHKKQYEVIKKVDFNYITTPTKVYSLKVEGGSYVADNIITHNSIYGFNGASPETLLNITKARDVKIYHLNENYRNRPAILNFAKGIIQKIGLTDTSISIRDEAPGLVRQGKFSLQEIVLILKKQTNYTNWFFLCRFNRQIEEVGWLLEKNKIPYTTFKKAQLTKDELDERMNENSIKLLTIHTAKGLEANNVIVYGAQWKNDEEIRINYVAATRAKNILIWMNKVNKISRLESWE